MGGLLVTDTLYSIIQLTGGYHTGSPIDLGWMTWYACWGAAALHPTMTTLAEPAPRGRSASAAGGWACWPRRRCWPRPSSWSSWCGAGTPRAW